MQCSNGMLIIDLVSLLLLRWAGPGACFCSECSFLHEYA